MGVCMAPFIAAAGVAAQRAREAEKKRKLLPYPDLEGDAFYIARATAEKFAADVNRTECNQTITGTLPTEIPGRKMKIKCVITLIEDDGQ